MMCLLIGIFGLIGWKVYDLKVQVRRNKTMMKEFQAEIEVIEDTSNDFVVSSLKDKKEGIIFFENPVKGQGGNTQLNRTQTLQAKIDKLRRQIEVFEGDIVNLKERNVIYENEIKDLQNEYDKKRKEQFDIQPAGGEFADNIFQEFE